MPARALRVLAYRRDKGGAAERELHLAFNDYSVRGEWFRREGMVETWLDGFVVKYGKPEKWHPVVKIGITEGDPGVRLSTMQVGCPLELKVLAYRRR